jgi:hypothetical protein
LSVVKDFSSDTVDTSFVRHINRWRLERAEPIDPKNPNKLSAPKKKIVYWIENSVPDEYRAAVREGIAAFIRAEVLPRHERHRDLQDQMTNQ